MAHCPSFFLVYHFKKNSYSKLVLYCVVVFFHLYFWVFLDFVSTSFNYTHISRFSFDFGEVRILAILCFIMWKLYGGGMPPLCVTFNIFENITVYTIVSTNCSLFFLAAHDYYHVIYFFLCFPREILYKNLPFLLQLLLSPHY